MAIQYEINMFETDPQDASKTFITFIVTNENDKTFVISKSVTTGSNTDVQLCTAAQAAAQTEIDTWVSNQANLGKKWNPDTSKIE